MKEGGKEAFIIIIAAVHVAPFYLVSLCERFEKPAASMFKAEDLKREDFFFQNLGTLSMIRHYRTSGTSASFFVIDSYSRRIWILF